jgi:hypothetical protein
MSKERSDYLFQLIKSMRKSEKRYFKIKNNSQQSEDTKYLQLFDAIDKLTNFDENNLIETNSWIIPKQFSNLKAHLYKKILQSLKEYSAAVHEEINIRENIDYIQILFDRSLYQQSMQLLQKVKKSLRKSDNLELYLEVLKWEKNLLPYSLGKNNQDRVRQIVAESNTINKRITRINLLTNLAVELNSIYLKTGYIRNKTDFDYISQIFIQQRPSLDEQDLTLQEKLLWYEVHHSYLKYIQDFKDG